MAKYIVVRDPGGKKTRVLRVEETRPGAGLSAADLRGMPLERRTRLAKVVAWLGSSRGEMSEWADRWHLRGIVIFFLLVYGLPMLAVVGHASTRNEAFLGVDGAGLVGLGVLLSAGLLGFLFYLAVRPKRR
ncbi:MAG: hypothetical protein AAB434_02415 [Planctomycetota bacterium]